MRSKGFTLIEMMVVVVVIGMLSLIASQKYADHTAKAQMTESVLLAKNLSGEVLINLQSGSCTSENKADNEIQGKYARVFISEGTEPWPESAPNFPTNCYISIAFLTEVGGVSKILQGRSIGLAVYNNGKLVVQSYNGDIKRIIPDTLF